MNTVDGRTWRTDGHGRRKDTADGRADTTYLIVASKKGAGGGERDLQRQRLAIQCGASLELQETPASLSWSQEGKRGTMLTPQVTPSDARSPSMNFKKVIKISGRQNRAQAHAQARTHKRKTLEGLDGALGRNRGARPCFIRISYAFS